MGSKWLGLLGITFLAVAARQAAAQECERQTFCNADLEQGRQSSAPEDADAYPRTVRIEVPPRDRKPGDIQGFKYVGKRLERVYFRDVERPLSEREPQETSGWHYRYDGKRTIREGPRH